MHTSPLAFIPHLPDRALAHALGIKPHARGARHCIIEDDRTPEQKKTHRWGVVARDRTMSGWGGASGGTSRCAWACPVEVNTDRVFNWARSCRNLQRVALVDLATYRPPAGTAHFHIYVCDPDHVAARY